MKVKKIINNLINILFSIYNYYSIYKKSFITGLNKNYRILNTKLIIFFN